MFDGLSPKYISHLHRRTTISGVRINNNISTQKTDKNK